MNPKENKTTCAAKIKSEVQKQKERVPQNQTKCTASQKQKSAMLQKERGRERDV